MDRSDAGTTLIEVLVVTVLMGVLGALGTTTLAEYRLNADQRSLAQETVSLLRTASTQAVSRSTAHCVRFSSDGTSATAFRGACGSGTVIAQLQAPGRSRFASPSFGSGGGTDVLLLPRGTATGGTVSVVRGDDKGTARVVRVEPLTSRVSHA